MALSFHDLSEQLSLGLLLLGNLILQLDGLVLQLLKFLLEFIFNVEVSIGKSFLAELVFVEQVVKLVHFKVQVLKCNLELTDFAVMSFHIVVESYALLLQNRFPSKALLDLTRDLLVGLLLVD